MAGLAGRGEPSCLSLSLTVQSREGDWSLQASRRCSWGRAGETVHLFRPVGLGCPRTGFWHFLQVLTGAGVACCTCSFLSIGVREASSAPLSARRAVTVGVGGERAGPPSTSNTRGWIRSSRLCSFRSKALGGSLLLFSQEQKHCFVQQWVERVS